MKKIFFIFLFCSSIISFGIGAFAEDQGDTSATALPKNAVNEKAVDQKASGSAFEKLKKIEVDLGGNSKALLDELESRVNSVRDYGTLQSFEASGQGIVEQVLKRCADIRSKALSCCQDPNSCSGGVSEESGGLSGMLSQVIAFAPIMGGGAGKCVSALHSVTEGLFKAKEQAKLCGHLNQGLVKEHSLHGCGSFCKQTAQLFQALEKNTEGALRTVTDETRRTNALLLQKSILGLVSSSYSSLSGVINTCNKQLTKQKIAGLNQAVAMGKGIKEAYSCYKKYTSNDEAGAAPSSLEGCANTLYSRQHPERCGLGSNVSLAHSGKTSSTEAQGKTSLGTSDDVIPEEDLFDNDDNVSPSAKAGLPGGGGGAGFGGGVGSGGTGGASKKSGGRRRAPVKSPSLIAGYKSSKGGGGSGGNVAFRRPSSGSWKKFFKNQKKKKSAQNKKTLAALSKLIKAGISLDTTASIFEKVTKRFEISATKENMFDYYKGKALWIRKK